MMEENNVKEQIYLFVFEDGSTYEMNCGISFKDALWEMSKYTDQSSVMLMKCLKGFDDEDIEEIINLFHHFAYKKIAQVYIIKEKLYDAYS